MNGGTELSTQGRHMCVTSKLMMKLMISYIIPDKHTALIWQKEASDKSDISRKRAKCVCHLY